VKKLLLGCFLVFATACNTTPSEYPKKISVTLKGFKILKTCDADGAGEFAYTISFNGSVFTQKTDVQAIQAAEGQTIALNLVKTITVNSSGDAWNIRATAEEIDGPSSKIFLGGVDKTYFVADNFGINEAGQEWTVDMNPSSDCRVTFAYEVK
jgi:hypothetical protein